MELIWVSEIDDLVEALRSIVKNAAIGEWKGSWMERFYLDYGPPTGGAFGWNGWERPDDEWFVSEEVPDRSAQVDLMKAWEASQADEIACQRMLDNGELEIEDVLKIWKNRVAWLRFWTDRCPDPEERQKLQWRLRWEL